MPKMHQNTSFSHQKSKNFLGRGHSPLPKPLPRTEGTPLLIGYPTPQVPPLQLDPSYTGSRLPPNSRTLNDLNAKIKGFVDFWRFWAARHISRANCAQFALNSLQIGQDKLYVKFSALNVDFNSPSLDLLGSRKPV